MRADLLALTPEAVAALANLGLVKRALKELEQGKAPEISEDADGVVTGVFPDAATARLPPGVPLRDAPCTCGAATVCRHRVALALAYPAWVGTAGEGPAVEEPAPGTAPWSPGEIDDEALRQRLGRRTFERAAALRRTGVTVTVRRPGRADPAAAELPSCTVRFLAAGDLTWARCDCVAQQDCEHVAIAVWAFRAADARDREAPRLLVEVADERPAASGERGGGEALDQAAHLAAEILLDGAAHSGPSLAPAFALCREALRRAGQTWPFTLLDDLEEQLGAWQARSARYEAARVAALLAELAARRRAADGRGELPPPFILGQGEALETRLDHLRLVSLGARVTADGRDRDAEILLADPDTATVLVLRKRWTFPDGEEPLAGPELAGRRAASGATLEALARGQTVTRVARRRANRLLVLGDARGGLTSVMPQAGAWESLPAPLQVTRLADLEQTWAARPPRLLRPRVLAEDVHVLAVAAVEWIADLPGTQSLLAAVRDAGGREIRLRKPWRAVAPRALEYLAAALSGAWGPVRFISGEIHRHLGRFEMEPLAVACDRLVVPDIEKGSIEKPPRLETAREHADPPVESAAAQALSLLEEGAHHGLRHAATGYPDRLAATAHHLEGVGLADCAARLRSLATAIRASRSQGETWPAAADAWNRAAIRLHILREAG